jgi:hypothetical protein
MDDPADSRAWSAAPSVKAKNVVQRQVTALLDELAPERVLSRADRIKLPVEQYRTPSGCVLQAATAAVSVSWFAEANTDAPLGELHVVVWRGVVSRRGAPQVREGATLVKETVLYPMDPSSDQHVWRSKDSKTYDTGMLAAECVALLEKQIAGEAEKGSS